MEPVPSTVTALEQLSRYGDETVRRALERLVGAAERLVPSCTGVSLTVVEDPSCVTVVATTCDCAAIDVAEPSGPAAISLWLNRPPADQHPGRPVDEAQVLDERLWSLFSRATAVAGVATSLSLPLLHAGELVGGVDLYASLPDAFVGHHEELAAAVGGWAPGAVRDADLSFRRLTDASDAVRRLDEANLLNVAVGIVAASRRVTTTTARLLIRDAALRAGVPEPEVVRQVVDDRRLDR